MGQKRRTKSSNGHVKESVRLSSAHRLLLVPWSDAEGLTTVGLCGRSYCSLDYSLLYLFVEKCYINKMLIFIIVVNDMTLIITCNLSFVSLLCIIEGDILMFP